MRVQSRVLPLILPFLFSPVANCRIVSFEPACGFHGFRFSAMAPIVFMFTLETCFSSPVSFKSTSPIRSVPVLICSPVARYFVRMSAGFCVPSILPIITCLLFTRDCMYRCPTSMCRILPTPILRAACSAAEESHQILGVSTFIPKSCSAKFLMKIVVLPQCDNALISASPELVAGSPG